MKTTRESGDDLLPIWEYVLTGVSSWLIPGAGHWILGYRLRGVILAVSIIGLFWFGESALGNNMPVSRAVNPIFFGCQIGNGLSTLVSQSLWGKPRYPDSIDEPDRSMPRYYHFGLLLTTVSGLLNILAVLHVLDPRTWRQARAAGGENAPPPEAGAPGRREAQGGGGP